MRRPNGAIFYAGPSALDGAPIVAIAMLRRSTNAKTADMVQTYILRADVAPLAALKSGADRSICGTCPLRPLARGGCYVQVGRAPTGIFGAMQRGRYPALSVEHARYLRGRAVRRGSYGDPSAVPAAAWAALDALADGGGKRTGYTHPWRRLRAQRADCMASVESAAQRDRAKRAGWRTFRVRASAADPLLPGEIVCPASEEGGRVTSCAKCGLCNGAGPRKARVDIAIIAHGATRRKAAAAVAVAV